MWCSVRECEDASVWCIKLYRAGKTTYRSPMNVGNSVANSNDSAEIFETVNFKLNFVFVSLDAEYYLI